jgi:hypothetical protein
MNVEQLMKQELEMEAEGVAEKLSQCHFVNYKPLMT